MDLVYTNAEHSTIKATLAEGEVLGNHAGPLECFVPIDPANVEYADILVNDRTVAPFTPPTGA